MDYLGPDYLDPVLYREAGLIGRGATQRSLAAAGLGIGDVDVFSVYDPNAWEVIRQLEAFGLCEVGEGGAYVESGAIGLKGASPVNPDGGCLSYTWNGTQQMTLKVVEGVRQIRGSAVHQLEGVEVAVAANAGSGALHHEVVLLGRDRR
jgi:acetyl-CoA acetyltransferase